MLLSSSPPLLLAGDYFAESNFGGCLCSGFAAADALAGALRGDSGVHTAVGQKRKERDEDEDEWPKGRGRNRNYASRTYTGA
mmetsp:Transcript_95311/g.204574  ORF Transcript_95311/g.204574 Transcript_95311/m.204574 type:complete len:82 (-) Transcript_95311:114-359(-)